MTKRKKKVTLADVECKLHGERTLVLRSGTVEITARVREVQFIDGGRSISLRVVSAQRKIVGSSQSAISGGLPAGFMFSTGDLTWKNPPEKIDRFRGLEFMRKHAHGVAVGGHLVDSVKLF